VASLSITELIRLRLYLAFVVVALVIGGMLTSLSAVDESARLKLAVVVITGGIGFVTTLLAMLIGASQLRRDLDNRVSVMLFAKPLPVASYLGGRLLGVVCALSAFLLIMSVIITGMMAWRFGHTPQMRQVAYADTWSELSSSGGMLPVKADRQSLNLSGVPGNGALFHFSHLQAGGHELLLRVDARSRAPGISIEHVAVEVLASASFDLTQAQILSVASDSPYGGEGTLPVDAHGQGSSRIQMRARDQAHQDLSLDYCRLRLPASCIDVQGQSWVQIIRLDAASSVLLDRQDSLMVALQGGSFLANLVRGFAVLLAQATLLCAFTLLVATVSNLAVALLGGLSLYFAGNALWALRETLLYGEPGQVAQRLVHLGLDVLPDFDRTGVSAQLAAGHAVSWDMVSAAWTYDGIYAGIFIGLAWFSLARREL
jgi:hypothetical protein